MTWGVGSMKSPVSKLCPNCMQKFWGWGTMKRYKFCSKKCQLEFYYQHNKEKY